MGIQREMCIRDRFAQAVRRSVKEMPDKDALRRRAEDFSLEKSVDGYLRIVEELVNGEKI